jgi:hypothetical protein
VVKQATATNTYTKTEVVIIDPKIDTQFASDLGALVTGEVSPFPDGEASSSAQVLVLLGK